MIPHTNNKKVQNLSIKALNCHGIIEKLDDPNFTDLVRENDIFGVSETWGKDKDSIKIPGYKFYPLHRNVLKGPVRGGIGLFINENIKKHVKIRYDLSNENVLWCKLEKKFFGFAEDVFIGSVYIPPEQSSREKRLKIDHFKQLKETTAKIATGQKILIGDLNARTQNLKDTLTKEKHDEDIGYDFYSNIENERNNSDKVLNSYGKRLTEYCIATRSYIANGRTLGDLDGKLTCHQKNGSSTVDYAIISENLRKYVKSFRVMDPNMGSDHCPIKLVLKCPHILNSEKSKKSFSEKLPPFRWNEVTKEFFTRQIDSKTICDKMKNLDEILEKDNDVDSMIKCLNSIYSKSLEGTNKPRKSKKKNKRDRPKKWYDRSCYEVGKRLKLVAQLVSKSPSNPHLRGSLVKTRKEYKKLLRRKRREWNQAMIQKLESMEEKDPKEYWKMVNKLREKDNDENGTPDIEIFTEYFEKLFSEKNPEGHEEKEKFVLEKLNELNIQKEPDFTMEELKKAIHLLKKNKAAGEDRIPAEILKATPLKLLEIILKIMNKIKNTCNYPKTWAMGIVSLILKDGDEEDPNNYRAITVINSLAKVLAIMMNNRLEEWCERENIIRKEQIGFEKKCRPADHIFVMKTLTDNYNNQGKKVYACFVDFRKAFDTVWRTGLFYKLLKKNMSTNFIKLIKNMYEKTSNSLKTKNGFGRPFCTHRGVQQGCILSPKLFNIFINDIPSIFDEECKPLSLRGETLSCLMYADDLVMLSESPEGLQKCLDKLKEYTIEWGLEINEKKTKVLIFQRSGKRLKYNFNFGDKNISVTDTYKYLGTTLTNTGNFKINCNTLKKKGLRAAYIINSNIGKHSKVSTAIKIFEKTIEPILTYNCEVTEAYIPNTWDYDKFKTKIWESSHELNKVVLSFLRQLMGVHKKTTNMALMAETGKFPICIKIYTHILKYWLRVQNPKNKMLYNAYLINHENYLKGQKNWCKIVYYLLKHTDTSLTKTHTMEKDINSQKIFKTHLIQNFMTWWKAQAIVTGENKLDFYYKYKKSFIFEKYLDLVPKGTRIPLTRLRLSCHPLPIETGRYSKNKIERENRICPICTVQEVGDEEHYLRRCSNSIIKQTRDKFTNDIKDKCQQMASFSIDNIIDYCMLLIDTSIHLPLAIYTKDIINIFTEITNLQSKPETPTITRSGRQIKKPERYGFS